MPTDMTRYGPHWAEFSAHIRFTRARYICECTGECRLHHGHRCNEVHHKPARFAKGIIRLTVAHLCKCDPPCQDPTHVKAMCQRCHLRVDSYEHARKRLVASGRVPKPPVVRSIVKNTYPPLFVQKL